MTVSRSDCHGVDQPGLAIYSDMGFHADKNRKFKILVSSETGSLKRSIPANERIAREPYSVSLTPGLIIQTSVIENECLTSFPDQQGVDQHLWDLNNKALFQHHLYSCCL